jgi:hypothetical protein
MQEGIIKMESVVGKGTSCIITLDFDIIESRTEVLSSEPPIYDLGGKTMVEDNAMNQMVIKMITKKWLNTTVLYANNGQEGLDVLKQIKLILF